MLRDVPWRTLLAALTLALTLESSSAQRAVVKGRQLLVDGKPFIVQGICYSPIPINESVYFAPYGDYFTADYSFIWLRDLPLIKAMGANVVRTYGWQVDNDHTAFLDAAYNNGLYVMATFYMGEASETPVSTAHERSLVIDGFVSEVKKYADHAALLFWSFGNELNGVWNGYLQALGKDPDKEQCEWDERYDDLGGCWIHKGAVPGPESPCFDSSYCVYKRLFTFIGDAAAAAKAKADVLVVSAFADVDGLYDKVGRAGDFAASLDAWTAQVYRGDSFGNFFAQMGNNTAKPVLLTEYGVDAYHDVCGKGKQTPCYNVLGDNSGSFIDEESQANFARNLTYEILKASSTRKGCDAADRGAQDCTCIGGFLMSWTDEYWKGAKSQAGCMPPKGSAHFSPKKCQEKAHVTCGNWDAADHDLCGYFLEAAPDHYVNEEWFGITSPARCTAAIDALTPRKAYWEMRAIWTGEPVPEPLPPTPPLPNGGGKGGSKAAKDDDEQQSPAVSGAPTSLFSTCGELLLGRCVALGDGGKGDSALLGWALGGVSRKLHEKPLPCSGRGKCTADWEKCGAGSANVSATPCCDCHWGYAGAGCEEYDVRIYFYLGSGGILSVLVLGMIASSIATALLNRWQASKPELMERLIYYE